MNLRHGHVKSDTDKGEGNLQQLTGQDVKAECAVDEKRVEFTDTADDHCLEKSQEEKAVRVWISDGFPCLLGLPLFLFDTLVVAPDTLDKFTLGGVIGPPDFRR